MTPNQVNWERGRRDGEDDARNAWVGSTWKRESVKLPAGHAERQDYLAAYAQGFARYNDSVFNRYADVPDD